MKRFLIHVSTYWCGMDSTFRAVAESEIELWDWDELWSRVDETAYYDFTIEECEDDDEWNEYSGEILGQDDV